MNNVLDLLNSNLTGDVMRQFSDRIGADEKQTSAATQGAINILLAAMNKNAKSEEGASGLLNALQHDHDGSVLDNLMDFAKGQSSLSNRTTNGAGILGHLLGSNQGNAIEMLTKMSGLNKDKSSSLLSMLAPIVMGAVGKSMFNNNSNSGTGGLMDILSNTMNSRVQSQEEQSMLEKLLDRDGDGSVIDDLLNIGLGFLRRNK